MVLEFRSIAHETTNASERTKVLRELQDAWGQEAYRATRYPQFTPARHKAERHAAIAAHAFAIALAELTPRAYDSRKVTP